MNKYEHIILPEQIKQSLSFSPKTGGGRGFTLPERERISHAQRLLSRFAQAREENITLKQERAAISIPSREGTYLEITGATNCDLITKSLESQKAGIRLLNVRTTQQEEHQQTFATIYIPHDKENCFLKKIEDYQNSETRFGKPKNDLLVRSIEDIKLALVKALWTDNSADFPTEQLDWYEVWIRTESENVDEHIAAFKSTIESLHINYKDNSILSFPERTIFLVQANAEILGNLLAASDYIAEFRKAATLTGFIAQTQNSEQREWVQDILQRVTTITNQNSFICVLDTGVNNHHPLLSNIILDDKCGTVVGEGLADRDGHGTEMCGIVIYGDMSRCISHNNPIYVTDAIASIKLKPYNFENPKEVWGALTHQAVASAETIFPNRLGCYCMALTAEDCEDGKPSSWSGAIDQITFLNKNLFLISAGNIDLEQTNIHDTYPDGTALCAIQNPAQSWNSIAIGAYTTKLMSDNPSLLGRDRVAPSGGISPFSRTSTLWQQGEIIKPEVVFEGGNLYKTNNPQIPYSSDEDLEVLTTSKNFAGYRHFETLNGTSAATALASNFVSKIQMHYPNFRAETIRGLIVHSAEWTECMKQQFPVIKRADMVKRLRHCGYGVPQEERALFSFNNGLTYIAQEQIQPYKKEKSTIRINEMHFYELPWPTEILEQLGEIEVSMKITLSYFIEPAPGKIGWKDKYRYASCGLRFDVNVENESKNAFQARINREIEAEENDLHIDSSQSSRWTIGVNNRKKGSIHSDKIKLTAAQLATCNLIAVYPIGGWWKTRPNLKRYNQSMKYSLIVSLDTPAENVDIYNVVKTKIETIINTPVEVAIPIQ